MICPQLWVMPVQWPGVILRRNRIWSLDVTSNTSLICFHPTAINCTTNWGGSTRQHASTSRLSMANLQVFKSYTMIFPYLYRVGKTTINCPFRNGSYELYNNYLQRFGAWLIIVFKMFYPLDYFLFSPVPGPSPSTFSSACASTASCKSRSTFLTSPAT